MTASRKETLSKFVAALVECANGGKPVTVDGKTFSPFEVSQVVDSLVEISTSVLKVAGVKPVITKQSHPFIYNTLGSNRHWRLYVKRGGSYPWWACLQYDEEDQTASCGDSPTEALDRLEAVLQGKDNDREGKD